MNPDLDLPEGWASAKLLDIVSPSKEKVGSQTCPDAPYPSLGHPESGTNRILGHGLVPSPRKGTSIRF